MSTSRAARHGRVLYDYTSAEASDLTLKQGDVVEILEMDESGWWTGRLQGKVGQFPGEYVAIVQDAQASTLGKRKPPPPPVAEQATQAPVVMFRVKVLWDYQARAGDEASVPAGQLLRVVNNTKSADWWNLVDDKGKIFPKNYTEVVEEIAGSEPASSAVPPPPPPPPMADSSSMAISVGNTAIGNTSGYALGRDMPIWYHEAYANLLSSTHLSSPAARPNKPKANSKEEFDALAGMFEFMTVVLERASARVGNSDALHKLKRATLQGSWIAATLPVQEILIDLDQPNPVCDTFYAFLNALTGRVREMRQGEAIIVPFGWNTTKARGKFLCVVGLNRQDLFSLSLLPPTDEPEADAYHHSIFDTATGKTKFGILHFENIPKFRLTDSSFWFMLFRLSVFPHEANTVDHIYQVLLPSLNHTPLRQQPPSMVFVTSKRDNSAVSKSSQNIGYGDARTLKKAWRACLILHFGLTPQDAKRIVLELKRELVLLTFGDLKRRGYASEDERLLIQQGLNQLANAGAKFEGDAKMAPVLADLAKSVSVFSKELASMRPPSVQRAPPNAAEKAAWGACLPMFGHFRLPTPESIDALAGTRTLKQIQRPVQISLVPNKVNNFHEVAQALRHCLHVCTLLDNQKTAIKNTYLLRVAMIVHLFSHVIPLPSAKRCFWRTLEMRYETQADLLRLLEMVSRHFVSASLSLHVSRSFDAQRIVTMAAIATIADVVAKVIACDIPSQFSLHLSGRAPGPLRPFGFEIGYFLEESGFLEFADASLCASRTLILDYFSSLNTHPDNVIFRFEHGMEYSTGDDRLIDQLCLQMGFPRVLRGKTNPLSGAAMYFTGEDALLIDFFPELALYRDIVFLFKAMLSPNASQLPPVKAWLPTDAKLTWSVAKAAQKEASGKKSKKEDETAAAAGEEDEESVTSSSLGVNRDLLQRPLLTVAGFGQKQLKCASFSRTYTSVGADGSRPSSAIKSFLGFFGLAGNELPRAPPSGANPSNLVNENVETEDDVLHIRTLPDFQGRLGARDCELLVSYLTAPYIRIPLLLQFFAEQSRINCLSSPELQNVLDSCLFEPSLFQAGTAATPEVIPSPRREELSTAAGLLFSELQTCPHVALKAFEDMLFFALELDVGKYSPVTSAVLLYVSRTLVRVLGYLDFICDNATFLNSPNEIGGARGRCSQFVRGVGDPTVLDFQVWTVLEEYRKKMRLKLEHQVHDTLESWLAGAMKAKDIQLACVLHAHKAYLFQGSKEMTAVSATASLAAFVFVTSNFRFTAEASITSIADEVALKRLGINQVDLFLFFQQQRVRCMEFFKAQPGERNKVMEELVRIVTLTVPESGTAPLAPIRNWVMLEQSSEGRFVPDTELDAYRKALASITSRNFEEWLRQTTTLAVDTEINIQLGEFTLKKNHMQLLPDEFFAFEDFEHVIGKYNPQLGDALQCAEVSNTSNRLWFRLVGKRHDVQLWKPDERVLDQWNHTRRFPECIVDAKDKWVINVLEPFRISLLSQTQLFLVENTTITHFARLTGLIASPLPMTPATPIEVVVFQDPPTVHVYHVVEFGRRFLSVLAFSSDAFFSFGEFHSNKVCLWPPGQGLKLAAGKVVTSALPPAPSLIITRNLTSAEGVQTFVPPKFLFGLIPHCLLEQYDFWQSLDGNIVGVAKPASQQQHTKLVITLFKDSKPSADAFSQGDAYAVCKRITKQDGPTTAAAGQGEVCHVLLNPMFAPPSSPLRALAMLFSRMDNLSHILMWSQLPSSPQTTTTTVRPNDSLSVDLVELPRARLNFACNSAGKWMLKEHAGLFISPTSLPNLGRFVGLPCGLILENVEQEYFILLPATCRPTRQFRAMPASGGGNAPFSQILCDFASKEWISHLNTDIRHYLLPVHASRQFVFTPTLASTLYLLLLKFASREYADAFNLANVCVSDITLTKEEEQIFSHLAEFNFDHSPDAHAVRLKISIAMVGAAATGNTPLPWDLEEEYAKYCVEFHRVSATCRLTVEEELSLSGTVEGEEFWNRRQVLLQLVREPSMALRAPAFKQGFPQFDQTVDKTALEDRQKASSWKQTLRKFSSAKPMSYSRPEEVTGAAALRIFEKFVREGVSIRGTVGFVFIFELMTGTLALRILPDDSCYNWGCLFLRRLPSKKFQKQQTMTSVLRILSYNPKIAGVVPKYEDNRKHKISILFKGSNVIQKLLENLNQYLRGVEHELEWPRLSNDVPNLFAAQLSAQPDLGKMARTWLLNYRIANHACSKRVLNTSLPECKTRPLNALYTAFVREASRTQLGRRAFAPKQLDISFHPSTRSRPAKQVLERLANDDVIFCQEANAELEPILVSDSAPNLLPTLQTQLETFIAKEMAEVDAQIKSFLQESNHVPLTSAPSCAFLLRKLSGQEVTALPFDFLVGLSMCQGGDAEFARFSPHAGAFKQDALADIMFRSNRIKQANRALRLVIKLIPEQDGVERRLAAEMLARELSASRFFIGSTTNEYDPRFLAFEFTNGILLRKSQIELVNDFMHAMEGGGSTARVHQMIMGAGKTTTISPLLSLMLGTKSSLVVQVVPQSLLEFSRTVMRECFSSPIFAKPVYTFEFNRVSEIGDGLVRKLKYARSSKSVVCTTPAALKSFFLKVLEALHILDNARVMRGKEVDEGHSFRGIMQRSVFGFSRPKKQGLLPAERDALILQLQRGLEIVSIFRAGKLLLDEVDLILHPLKSELNWPIGVKLPLDFTATRSKGVHGLRWQVPFYLLDAIFYCSGGEKQPRLAWATDDSREAQSLLASLTAAIREGEERRMLQRQPHLVLLSRLFYQAKIKPLLARWMVLFVMQKGGVRGIRDEMLLSYLMLGPKKAAPETLRMLKDSLADDNFKLLNLSHDWLETYCPFCISRIDRVKYGLLSKEHLRPTTPKNRKLLAVPFVGKDVPSEASEFSHPDILIGLTTLAYRYEGLRYSDFIALIRALKERLEDEHGAYPTRPSAILYTKWIEAAGGRVRGTRLEERRRIVESSVTDDMWPLQLLDVNDALQMDMVFALVRHVAHASLVYLDEIIFPETMQHQGLKLSACGQELGGTMLFSKRIGFSGTPSDLLPVELGRCHYERGSDGKMIQYLSDPEICTVRRTGADWTVQALLEDLCAERDPDGSGRPLYDALIDTGALITGMSNEEVAQFILARLPVEHVDGVVYLDAQDCKMIMMRSSSSSGDGRGKTCPLDRCGVDIARRFTFYDQIHTTGMDIKQAPSGRAALTLGKDLVFRDYAQGAFRMRQIGKGQTIEVIVIPEVEMLVQVQCAAGRGQQLSGADLDRILVEQRALPKGRVLPTPAPLLLSIISWLVINTCIHEKVQFNLLSEQSCNNVWRKRAFALMESKVKPNCAFTQQEVDVFREGIDYSVENSIPTPKSFVAKLEQAARERIDFLSEPADRAVIERLLAEARESESRDHAGPPISTVAGVEGDGSPEDVAKERAFNSEQVQEQEAEQEVEVEEQQEKEEERMEVDLQEEFVKKKYARDDEKQKPWRLQDITSAGSGVPPCFFPSSQFAVHKSLLESIKPIKFPETMLLSKNYYESKWTFHSFRRLKNVICVLEYYLQPPPPPPQGGDIDPITLRARLPMTEEKHAHIQRAFAMLESGNKGIDGAMAVEVVRAMDVDVERADFAFLQKCFAVADKDNSQTLHFQEFLSFIQQRYFYQASPARHFVAISLFEAETLRRILHLHQQQLRQDAPSPKLFFAIHSLATQTVLDCSRGYLPCSDYQQQAFYSLFRFLDSDVSFNERAVSILVRTLQENECAQRQTWFEDVRECRRRPRKYSVQTQPVGRIFDTPHEYISLEYRSTIVRIRELIFQRGLFVVDAFRLFDTNRDGLVGSSELNSGLHWLGLRSMTVDHVHAIVRALDQDCDGLITLDEFKLAFGDAKREEAIAKAGVRVSVDFDSTVIPMRAIRELYEENKSSSLADVVIPPDAMEKFRIKLKPPAAGLEKAWSSTGSISELEACIWRIPEEGVGGLLRSNRVQICLGNYAVKGQDRPAFGSTGVSSLFFAKTANEVTTIEIKDESRWGVSGTSTYMNALVERLFPHPVRFQQIWCQPRGSPIFAWRGVAPNSKHFVFLGAVVTTTDEPPALTDYRCVPKHWCTKASVEPAFVWKDSNATGGKKGSIWTINAMGLCWVNEGHSVEPPEGGFWDLKQRAFHISQADFDQVGATMGGKEPPKLPEAALPAPPPTMTTPTASSAAVLQNVVVTEDPNRLNLVAQLFPAPPAPPALEADRFPVHVSTTVIPAPGQDLRVVVTVETAPKPLPPPPPSSAATAAPPPRPSKPSSAAAVKRPPPPPLAAATSVPPPPPQPAPILPHPDHLQARPAAATGVVPPRPQKPSSAALVKPAPPPPAPNNAS